MKFTQNASRRLETAKGSRISRKGKAGKKGSRTKKTMKNSVQEWAMPCHGVSPKIKDRLATFDELKAANQGLVATSWS